MSSELPFPLVQASWKKAMDLGEGEAGFGHNFYKNLFTDFPILRETIFKGASIPNQEKNLPKSITAVLGLLTDMPKAVAALEALGARHIYYNCAIKPEQYAIVGANVVKTLSQILKPQDFDEATKAEWIAIYGVIQKTMIDACYKPSAAPWWARLYVKRGKEIQAILSKVSSSVAISKTVGSNCDLAAVAAEMISTKAVASPCASFAKGMSADQIKNLSSNLVKAIEATSNSSLSAFDKMVLDWFQEVVEENKNAPITSSISSSGSSSCDCSSSKCMLIGGAVVAAIAAGAFFLLKKKH